MSELPYVLVLFYSRHGSVSEMAKHIARGVNKVSDVEVKIRQVPDVADTTQIAKPALPDEGAPYCTLEELSNCSGLAIGSPSYFGSMAAPLKHFIDQTSTLWLTGQLIDKPACGFTSASTMHGGQEQCIHSMMTPLLHHGMIWVGLPYKNKELIHTMTGGTPYGASHLANSTNETTLTDDEKALCEAQGKRIAEITVKLRE
ncbi:NAD(P)H quinone oxidoreductase [Marinomonas ushuaiensis DSM 15871]|uniref:NAD(P)H quinone oxidoreductase n=1 Tax=Marinomonas ushuaiensis DSM 15871 TaxID=1122207 RepID=X7E0T7_9GAMM|nr:NAD(P)H:quinone oxidoreductase [Marinomonas ushuaiensis]ETX09572.1 NAD(P)H quinone oxidoreductase [Marinomonas ushuaiensis DSM 15871]